MYISIFSVSVESLQWPASILFSIEKVWNILHFLFIVWNIFVMSKY